MTISIQCHSAVVAVSVLASICIIGSLVRRGLNRDRRLPPGPKGLPLLGNLLQLSVTPWKEFEIWKKQYGPLVYITAGTQRILVLNTKEVTVELFDRRSHIYNGRPRLIVAGEILCGDLLISLVPEGDTYRKLRRAMNEALAKGRITQYCPTQTRQAVGLVDAILKNPDSWRSEISRALSSVILSIVYDLPERTSVDDPLITEMEVFATALLEAATPGRYLVEFFPWMKHLPPSIAKWKRDAEEKFRKFSDLWRRLFREVEDRIAEGDERPSFAGTLIRERERFELSDVENEWLSGALYVGGVETTSAVLSWFLLAMVVYPNKQKRCQEELDAVVGQSRMPTFQDLKSLPYIQATVREALRWRPIGPIAGWRVTTEDDHYHDFFIPKGTLCFANVWCINRDQDNYGSDADHFNPDRFISEDGEFCPSVADTKDGHFTYGFGPKICPGRYMANNAIFIIIASILWATNISPVKDETGRDIIPDIWGQVPGRISTGPLPFRCLFSPRFPEAMPIIAQTKDIL